VSAVGLPRSILIYAVALPLALFVGYVLAAPYSVTSLALVGLLLAVLSIPILLRWHYPLLIFAWNANITIFFLPGKPSLWMLCAGISLGISVLNCVLDKRIQFQNVRSITWPVLFLLAVVLITAKLTGGIGLRSFGSASYGGKKFVFIIAAIIGYFALSSQQINFSRARSLAGVYLLSASTAIAANLIYFLGPSFYILFLLFPVDNAMSQVVEDYLFAPSEARFSRLPGVMHAATATLYFLMMRYGIRGLLDLSKPWRLTLSIVLFCVSLLGGFRSTILLIALVLAVQFCLERLYRTRMLITILVVALIAGAALLPFSNHLPLSIQRSLTVLPWIKLDRDARLSAQSSWEWRVEMWKFMVPQIPQYLWIGKGYAIDPADMYLAEESMRRGLVKGYESSVVAGDYHSGPLSLLIPFGIFGVLAFLWLLIACIRLLYRNFRYSDERVQNINTFLLAYFVARVIFYFLAFGALHNDLPAFLGLAALSIAINGGMLKEPSSQKAEQTETSALQLA
jgi:hypothetical protein